MKAAVQNIRGGEVACESPERSAVDRYDSMKSFLDTLLALLLLILSSPLMLLTLFLVRLTSRARRSTLSVAWGGMANHSRS